MKIGLISDLHIWSDTFMQVVEQQYDVLVVAGDVAPNFERLGKSLKFVKEHYPNAEQYLFVPGNHEFYQPRWKEDHKTFEERKELLKAACVENGFLFLYREVVEIQGRRFVGCVGWAQVDDLEHRNEIVDGINDFRYMSPAVMTEESMLDQKFLLNEVGPEDIVITHFSPFVYPHHRWGNGSLNQYFCNQYLEAIMNLRKPLVWMFGHTHSNIELLLDNDSRLLVSNQFGYGGKYEHEDVGNPFRPEYFVEI